MGLNSISYGSELLRKCESENPGERHEGCREKHILNSDDVGEPPEERRGRSAKTKRLPEEDTGHHAGMTRRDIKRADENRGER